MFGFLIFSGYLLSTLVVYFNSYPIPEFVFKLFSCGVAFLLVCSCFALGNLLLNLLGETSLGPSKLLSTPLFLFPLAFGLGLGGVSTGVLLLGWVVPGPLPEKLLGFALILSFIFIVQIRSFVSLFENLSKPPALTFFSLEGVFFLLGGTGLLFSFIACFSPITYYDSLVYHLAIPSLYNMDGKISEIPSNLYSYFPQNMEMISLLVISLCKKLSPDYAINLIGWIISVLTSLVIYAWMSVKGWKNQGLLAVGLWWTAPPVLLLSFGAYVDVPLAFFTLMALLTFYEAWEQNWNPAWMGISAIFCSIAASTKYTGGLTFLMLSLFVGGYFLISRSFKPKPLLFFGSFFLFPFGFWLVKNFIHVGNPVFPFLFNVLGTPEGWTRANAAGYFQMLTEYGAKSNLFFEVIFSPWRIATSGLPFGGGMDVLGDFGWGLFLYGFLLALFVLKKNRQTNFLMAYGICHFLVWLITKPVLRFLVGILPVFAMIVACVLYDLVIDKKWHKKFLAYLLTGPWLISNFFIVSLLFADLKVLSVPLGLEKFHVFLAKRLSYYSAYQLLNGTVQREEKVLVLGEQRTSHLRVPYVASNIFALSQAAAWANQSETSDNLVEFLKNEKISYLCINQDEMTRLGGISRFGFSERGKNVFTELIRRKTTLFYAKNGVEIYKLL